MLSMHRHHKNNANRRTPQSPIWRRRGRKAAIIVSLTLATSALTFVGMAQASTINSDAQKFATQQKLNQFYSAVLNASPTVSEIRSSFGGARLDFDAGRMKVYVVGGITPEKYREIAVEHGIEDRLDFLPAKYSLASLELARAELQRSGIVPGALSTTLSGQRVIGIAINDDGSGLRIDVDRATRTRPMSSKLSQLTAAAFDIKISLADVTISAIERPTPTSGSRNNDRSPWTGGALMLNTSTCSTSFTIRLGTVGYGVLTAAHCPTKADGKYYTYSNIAFGSNYGGSPSIKNGAKAAYTGTANNTSGQAYFGATNTTTVRNVVDFGDAASGTKVCTGGANSGTHCGIQIADDNYAGSDGGYAYVGSTGYATDSSVGIAVVQGDSGGPVYSNSANLTAIGVISQGSVSVTCGTRVYANGLCFHNVYFAHIGPILTGFRANLT